FSRSAASADRIASCALRPRPATFTSDALPTHSKKADRRALGSLISVHFLSATVRYARASVLVYAATIFLSAFLLFQVQPLIAKFILLWFGCSAAVWSAALLVCRLSVVVGCLSVLWFRTY